MSHGHLRRIAPIAAAFGFMAVASAAAQTVTMTTPGGELRIQAGASAVLPAGFPADVWLPEGHALAQVEQAGDATILEYDVAMAADALAAGYASRMRAAGWTPAPVVPPASGRAFAWEKGDRAVVAAFSPTARGTRVRLQVLPRR